MKEEHLEHRLHYIHLTISVYIPVCIWLDYRVPTILYIDQSKLVYTWLEHPVLTTLYWSLHTWTHTNRCYYHMDYDHSMPMTRVRWCPYAHYFDKISETPPWGRIAISLFVCQLVCKRLVSDNMIWETFLNFGLGKKMARQSCGCQAAAPLICYICLYSVFHVSSLFLRFSLPQVSCSVRIISYFFKGRFLR